MTPKRPVSSDPQGRRQSPAQRDQGDPPIRLAHVLFVLWVAGSVAWAFFAAKLAHGQGWWALRPELAVVLVLVPPILAQVLANYIIKITGNPRFR